MADPYRSSSSSHLALPGFHDFSTFARSSSNDPGIGSSRSRPPAPFDNHFMAEINAVNASTTGAGGQYHHEQHPAPPPMTSDPAFDILDWYPAYQSCQRYFLDIAQHEPGTQALCALINIRLPFQYLSHPITSTSGDNTSCRDNRPSGGAGPASANTNYQFTFPHIHGHQTPGNLPSPNRSRASSNQPAAPFISLVPYIRRLTITGFDKPAILHGFFGDDYTRGILPHLDCERRNYLFAAKHGGWRTCKKQYDGGSGLGGGDETVPFMKPLDEARGEELAAAEKAWGRWLAMEDWMVGPYAPEDGEEMEGKSGNGNGGWEAQRTGRREHRDEEEGVMGGLSGAGGEGYGLGR